MSFAFKDDLIKISKQDPKNIVAIFLAGSRLYGCADENSDYDYVMIVKSDLKINDIIKYENIDIIIQDLNSFKESKSIFKYECLCSPDIGESNRLPEFIGATNKKEIFELAKEKSNSDYNKAIKMFNENKSEKAFKKLFHSIRIPLFARQLVDFGKIIDFSIANIFWKDINFNRPLHLKDEKGFDLFLEEFNFSRLEILKTLEDLCK